MMATRYGEKHLRQWVYCDVMCVFLAKQPSHKTTIILYTIYPIVLLKKKKILCKDVTVVKNNNIKKTFTFFILLLLNINLLILGFEIFI